MEADDFQPLAFPPHPDAFSAAFDPTEYQDLLEAYHSLYAARVTAPEALASTSQREVALAREELSRFSEQARTAVLDLSQELEVREEEIRRLRAYASTCAPSGHVDPAPTKQATQDSQDSQTELVQLQARVVSLTSRLKAMSEELAELQTDKVRAERTAQEAVRTMMGHVALERCMGVSVYPMNTYEMKEKESGAAPLEPRSLPFQNRYVIERLPADGVGASGSEQICGASDTPQSGATLAFNVSAAGTIVSLDGEELNEKDAKDRILRFLLT